MHSLCVIVNFTIIAGSILVVVMKIISLSFDLDDPKSIKGNKKLPNLPDLISYASYCLFPGTTVFGPFVTYSEHVKFLHPTPLVLLFFLLYIFSLE